MKSFTRAEFWRMFDKLPAEAQRLAEREYERFHDDPFHTSLRFKRIAARRPDIWSVRIGLNYRAVGSRTGDEIVWFWIGTHADYDELLRRL